MIVYQTPYFSEDSSLQLECMFISYPDESGRRIQLSDEEFLSAARAWSDKTLLISMDTILADWTLEKGRPGAGATYKLQTGEWDVYLQMFDNGEYAWCGLYPRSQGRR